MMGKEVPFKTNKVCDECGAQGAYDFYGDCYCPACVEKFEREEQERADQTTLTGEDA